ncbi:hypothetical protein ACKWRH_38145 [Bradyrhizobium sp. Pa8]|uniref:hypothetical protein n=1 Tax=Bradyrhizobium sp. Pa8 TaxID=3386552 RepID=UPI00403F3362
MRLIKATLKNTLAHTGALTNTSGQLIPADGTSTKPAYSFGSEPTLGLQRTAAGVMSVVGGTLKGTRTVGEVAMFLKEPPSLGKTTTDTGKDWLELNGATYNVTDYPALATFLGVSSGIFTLDDMYTSGRFPRSRTATTAARTAQADTVGPHTHPDVTPTTAAETQEHTHTFSGTTGAMNANAAHTHSIGSGANLLQAGGGNPGITGSAALGVTQISAVTNATNIDHGHTFSGTTAGRSASHNHTVTVSTPANTGTTETRPVALSFVFAVKT